VRVVEFGAFVEILPGTDGLLHVSEMATHRVQDVRSEVKEGDQVLVKVVNIDPSGKIRLSRKALIEGGPAEGSSEGQGGEPQPAGAYGGGRDSHDRPHGGDRDRGRGGDRPRGGDRGGRGRGPR